VPDEVVRSAGGGKDDHPVFVIDGLHGSRAAVEQRLALGVSVSAWHPRFLPVSLRVRIKQPEHLAPAGDRARPAVHQHQVLTRVGDEGGQVLDLVVGLAVADPLEYPVMGQLVRGPAVQGDCASNASICRCP
jgi:hypothetical protein